jgi:glycosyltransferase involved in cell wall biosynthesis
VANTLASFWAVVAAHAAARPSLLYIHESTPPEAFFPPDRVAAMLPLVREAFAVATRVSFLTDATRRYYADLAVRPNYCLNPGWIDLRAIDAFRAAHPRAELRAQLGIDSGERLVVNIGSVCERKGQTVFARAVGLLGRLDPALAGHARFVMIGGRDTSYDRDLADLLNELRHPNLQVRPETPNVYDWYGAADLFVCTSYEESFPRVILEAMGFGLPIVSTNVHGIPEIARDGAEAILVPPGDTHALATALSRVLLDSTLVSGLADRARRRVESAFGLEQVLPRHHALACALAGGHA